MDKGLSERLIGPLKGPYVKAKDIAKALTHAKGGPPCIVLRHKKILGKLDLRHCLVTIPVVLKGCEFLDRVDLRNCEFVQTLDVTDCTFHKEFNIGDQKLSQAVFRKDLVCEGATFKGTAKFYGIRCEGSGYFTGAKFDGGKRVDFRQAYFGRNAGFRDATFKGAVSFNAMRCDDSGYFDYGFCNEGPLDLGYAFFGGNLECNEAMFNGDVTFHCFECKGGAFFRNARFQSNTLINFGYVNIGGNFELSGTHFAGRVDLGSATVLQKLILVGVYGAANFVKEVDLRYASVDTLILAKEPSSHASSSPFPFRAALDLRGFTFERLSGSEHRAKQFVEAQHPSRFSRDPYMQLERYYSSIGNEAEATRIHFKGHCAIRENANREGSLVKWSKVKWLTDTVHRYLLGYGHKVYRLMWWIFIFIAIGVWIFWEDGALVPVGDNDSEVAIMQGGGSNPQELERKAVHRLLYSIDLLIEPVDLGIANEWKPTPLWRVLYMTLHVIAGWALLVIFLGWLVGWLVETVKRQ